MANAACGAVIAPFVLRIPPGRAEAEAWQRGWLDVDANRIRLAFLRDQILVAAGQEYAGHARAVDDTRRRRSRAARQTDRARVGVGDREVRVHAGRRRAEQTAERRFRRNAVDVAATGQCRRGERFGVVGANAHAIDDRPVHGVLRIGRVAEVAVVVVAAGDVDVQARARPGTNCLRRRSAPAARGTQTSRRGRGR